MTEEEIELKLMPNIGETIAKKLDDIGVKTSTQLKKLGSKKAFALIREKDSTACLHMLYALEGAIEMKRYTELSAETKKELKSYFTELKKKK